MTCKLVHYRIEFENSTKSFFSVLFSDIRQDDVISYEGDTASCINWLKNTLGIDPYTPNYAYINGVQNTSAVIFQNAKTLIPLLDVTPVDIPFTLGSHQYRFHRDSYNTSLQYYSNGSWVTTSQSTNVQSLYQDIRTRTPVIHCTDLSNFQATAINDGGNGYLSSNSKTNTHTVAFWMPGGTMNTVLYNDLISAEPYVIPTDPYEDGGGASSTGGGTGTFSETGDVVGIPGLPTLSAVDTGFITLFNPTATQVKQLAAYMWSNSFDMATFKNIVANPIDCILGLTIVPVNPPDAGTKAVTVGNIPTDVNMPYLSSQYVEVDCGTLNVQEFWGSYLDYSPYTKMSLYLPYIGIVPLDIDDVMNATISIKYHVDVLSGACVAYVLCNGTQLYTYIGQCSSNVPITSNDFTNTVNGILGIAGSIGSLVATGGASAPTEIGKIAGNAINALKPNIQKSGAMSGTGGLMGVQTPYLICQRPRQSVPASQNEFTGYPSNITATLSDLSGYTEVDKIHLEGVPCTNEEMDEIMTLLESGVYI